jgi:hypothetical protein
MHSPVVWADTSTAINFHLLNDLVNHCDADPVGTEMSFLTGKIELYDTTVNKTWSKMEGLLKTGKVRAIGVSNCSVKMYVFSRSLVRTVHLPLFCKPETAVGDGKGCPRSEPGRVSYTLTLYIIPTNLLR